MKKIILGTLPVAALSIMAFSPLDNGIIKLSESPLYDVSEQNMISAADRSKISMEIKRAYNIEDSQDDNIQLAMLRGQSEVILIQKWTNRNDFSRRVITEENTTEEGRLQISSIANILSKYE